MCNIGCINIINTENIIWLYSIIKSQREMYINYNIHKFNNHINSTAATQSSLYSMMHWMPDVNKRNIRDHRLHEILNSSLRYSIVAISLSWKNEVMCYLTFVFVDMEKKTQTFHYSIMHIVLFFPPYNIVFNRFYIFSIILLFVKWRGRGLPRLLHVSTISKMWLSSAIE